MSYQQPPGGAVNFALTAPYTPPQSANFNLEPVAGDGGGEVTRDYPIPPDFMVGAWHGVSHAQRATANYCRAPHKAGGRREIIAALRFERATRLDVERSACPWDTVAAKNGAQSRANWEAGRVLHPGGNRHAFEPPPARDRAAGQAWDGSIDPRDTGTRQPHNLPPTRDKEQNSDHRDTARYREAQPVEAVFYIPNASAMDFDFAGAEYQPPDAAAFHFAPMFTPAEVPTRPVQAERRKPWEVASIQGLAIRHPWDKLRRLIAEAGAGYTAQPPEREEGDPPTPPTLSEVYILVNNAQMIALPSGTPLAFSDLSISLDLDAFAWTCSAAILNRASAELIKPQASGPVEIEVTVNAYQWRFIVERYSTDRRFGKDRYTIKATSKTAMLGAPYAPKRSRRITAPVNAAQAMGQELDGTGFTVSWFAGMPDYVIPANAWGYQDKTAIEVITELARAVGAVALPSRMSSEVRIRPRYRVSPWALDALPEAQLDAIILDSITLSYSAQWTPRPLFNRVLVSGISAGVAVDVTRQGSAGDAPAPDVYDDLNLDPQQCAERGRAIIAESGDQEIVTLEIPLPTSGSPGLLVPGDLIEWRDTMSAGVGTWRGLVLENRVTVSEPGAAKVIQSIQVERHHYGNS
jgi:hypothetical protein